MFKEVPCLLLKVQESFNFHEMKKILKNFVEGIEDKDIKAFFQSKYYKDPIIIDDSLIDKGYIKIIR